jgi:uncharacterized protein YeaO (DUF488 family)
LLKLKSLKERASKDDGLRIMIARYPIRGQKIEDREWQQWWKELAPSIILHREYIKQKKLTWDQYKVNFTHEIKNNPNALEALTRLRALSADRTITILCHCIDENRCHRMLIKRMVEGDIWK